MFKTVGKKIPVWTSSSENANNIMQLTRVKKSYKNYTIPLLTERLQRIHKNNIELKKNNSYYCSLSAFYLTNPLLLI